MADYGNNRIYKITPDPSNPSGMGTIITFAGTGTAMSGGGLIEGRGNVARFYQPRDVVVDKSDNVYVADTFNNRIRKITPNRVVSTFAGTGTGFGDAGREDDMDTSMNGMPDTPGSAKFSGPQGVAVDDSGNVYVADTGNDRIRKITSTGVVSTFAGSSKGFVDDTGNTGGSAKFDAPQGVAVDSKGNVYVADTGNDRIRKITSTGVVSTFAGSSKGFVDDTGNTGGSAKFDAPQGVAVDSKGNVYVADTGNHRIRKITPNRVVTTLAGSGSGNSDGVGDVAKFNTPQRIAVDKSGNVYVADTRNNRICKITIPQ